MTDTDRRRQRIEAQVTHDEAVETLAGLILQLKKIGGRSGHITSTIGAVELDADDPLRSEAGLFGLSVGAFEGIDFVTVRELANSIVLARKDVVKAKALARAMGCNV